MDISKKLVETHSLTKEECLELFSLFNNSEVMEYLKEEAVKYANSIMEQKYLQEDWLSLQITVKTIAITVEYEEIIVM